MVKHYVGVRKRASYVRTGPSKGNAANVATATRLMRTEGFSQNRAAKAVGMSSTGLKKAMERRKKVSRSRQTELSVWVCARGFGGARRSRSRSVVGRWRSR